MTTEEHLTECTHDLICMVEYAKKVGDAQHIRKLQESLGCAIQDLNELKGVGDSAFHVSGR